jgi:hypothetical protein
MRRGGARREVSTRVYFRDASGKLHHEGWALNVSRGGVRVILEEKIAVGQEFEIDVGTGDGPARKGRVVWVQEEPDGVIVGVEFTGLSGTHESAPPPPAGAEPSDTTAAAPASPSTPAGDTASAVLAATPTPPPPAAKDGEEH